MSKGKPSFEQVQEILDTTWECFFAMLEDQGIDSAKVRRYMDAKDCFNGVADCVYEAAL